MNPSKVPGGSSENVGPHMRVPADFNELVAAVEFWPTADAQEFLLILQDVIGNGSDIHNNTKSGAYEIARVQSDKAALGLVRAFVILKKNHPQGNQDQQLFQLLQSVTHMRVRATPAVSETWELIEGRGSPVTTLIRGIRQALETLSQRARE